MLILLLWVLCWRWKEKIKWTETNINLNWYNKNSWAVVKSADLNFEGNNEKWYWEWNQILMFGQKKIIRRNLELIWQNLRRKESYAAITLLSLTGDLSVSCILDNMMIRKRNIINSASTNKKIRVYYNGK